MYYQSLEEFVKQKGIQLPKLEGVEEVVKGQVAYPGKKIKGKVNAILVGSHFMNSENVEKEIISFVK